MRGVAEGQEYLMCDGREPVELRGARSGYVDIK